MKRLVILLAACTSTPANKLPGVAIAPSLEARKTTHACATDVSWDGKRVGVTFRYEYDELGRLAAANGRYAGGQTDRIDYEWDNLDHLVHSLHVRPADGLRDEVTAQYSTLGDLLEYTMDGRRHVYSQFTDAGRPTRQVIAAHGTTEEYVIEYDAANRVARITPAAGGDATVYTYDDDARTITITSGVHRGVIVYDEGNRQLSESWTGGISTEELYAWSGDRLQTITYRAGSEVAPTVLETFEVHTYRYSCQ